MPECQKIKNTGLDQYGAECFGRLIFATVTSVELKGLINFVNSICYWLSNVTWPIVVDNARRLWL